MPTVPYNPVPSIGPSAAPASPLQREPQGLEVAAGVGVGRAIQSFGRDVDKVASIAEHHALALQGIVNDTAARNGHVDVMEKIGQADSEFGLLEGDAMVAALPAHQDRIKKIRDEALDSMPNPMARRMLDQAVTRMVGFALVDAGNKTGTQAKIANRDANMAEVDTAKRMGDLKSPGTMQAAREVIKSRIEAVGASKGSKRVTIDNVLGKELSKFELNAIVKGAANDPIAAMEHFNNIKDEMDPNDREVAQQVVNRNMVAHQSKLDADEIFQRKGFDPMKGPGQLQPMMDLADKYGERYGQNNAEYTAALRANVGNKYNVAMRGFRDQQLGYEHSISNFIMGKNDDNMVVDMEGIRGPKAPPEVRKAYEGLEGDGKRKVAAWVKRAAEGPIDWTPDRIKAWNELKGRLSDPETALEAFHAGPSLILDAHLPWSATRQLLDQQRNIPKHGNLADAPVNKAMQDLAPMVDSAGLRRGTPEYLQFRGALGDQLNDYMANKPGKVPREEIEKIGSRLLQNTYKDSWWGKIGFKKPVFQANDIPDEIKGTITQELKTKLGVDPTDEQIQRAYAFILYKRLYNQKAKEGEGKPGAPSAPPKPNLEGLGM